MNKTINYKIPVGNKTYEIPVRVKKSKKDDSLLLNGEDILKGQWELGVKLVLDLEKAEDVNPETVNFLLGLTGLTNREIGEYIFTEASNLSQWRRSKGISNTAWQTMRIFLYEFLSNDGKVQNIILRKNKRILPESA